MYYLFTHFQTFSKFLSQFLPLQVEETYFFQEAIAVSCFTLKEHVNSNAIVKYLYSAHFAVVSLVLRITASCKGKYLLNHGFQPFFQFFPVSSTSGGRNLFLPGRFKPGFNPVSSTRWKKPANPARRTHHAKRMSLWRQRHYHCIVCPLGCYDILVLLHSSIDKIIYCSLLARAADREFFNQLWVGLHIITDFSISTLILILHFHTDINLIHIVIST